MILVSHFQLLNVVLVICLGCILLIFNFTQHCHTLIKINFRFPRDLSFLAVFFFNIEITFLLPEPPYGDVYSNLSPLNCNHKCNVVWWNNFILLLCTPPPNLKITVKAKNVAIRLNLCNFKNFNVFKYIPCKNILLLVFGKIPSYPRLKNEHTNSLLSCVAATLSHTSI